MVCQERWEAVDPDTLEIITKTAKHAWISSRPLNRLNVHTRCNLGARYRWGIESGFLVKNTKTIPTNIPLPRIGMR